MKSKESSCEISWSVNWPAAKKLTEYWPENEKCIRSHQKSVTSRSTATGLFKRLLAWNLFFERLLIGFPRLDLPLVTTNLERESLTRRRISRIPRRELEDYSCTNIGLGKGNMVITWRSFSKSNRLTTGNKENRFIDSSDDLLFTFD